MAGPWTLSFSVLVPLPMPGSANVPALKRPSDTHFQSLEFCQPHKLTDGLPLHQICVIALQIFPVYFAIGIFRHSLHTNAFPRPHIHRQFAFHQFSHLVFIFRAALIEKNNPVSVLIVNQMGKTCIFEVDSKF